MPHRYASFNMEYTDVKFRCWSSTLTTNPWLVEKADEVHLSTRLSKHRSSTDSRQRRGSLLGASCHSDATEGLLSPLGQQMQLEARAKAVRARSPCSVSDQRTRCANNYLDAVSQLTDEGSYSSGIEALLGTQHSESNVVDLCSSQENDRLSLELLEQQKAPTREKYRKPDYCGSLTECDDYSAAEQDEDISDSSAESSSIHTIDEYHDMTSAYSWSDKSIDHRPREHAQSTPSSIASYFRHRVDSKIVRLFTDLLNGFSAHKEQPNAWLQSGEGARIGQQIHDYDSTVPEPWIKINYESPRTRRFGIA